MGFGLHQQFTASEKFLQHDTNKEIPFGRPKSHSEKMGDVLVEVLAPHDSSEEQSGTQTITVS